MGDKVDERRSSPPEPPEDERGVGRKLVERLIKRGLESGMDAISKSEDTVRGVIEGMRVPKEMISLALEQVDETKNGLYRAVAKEIRDFLESTNFATEAKKILTGLAFEVKMEVRFKSTEDEAGRTTVRPDLSADVSIKNPDKDKKRRSRE